MQCPKCNAQLEDDTVFCGNCGTQIAPLTSKGAPVTSKASESEDDYATVISTSQSYRPSTPQTPVRNNAFQPNTPYRGNDSPTILSSPPPARKNNIWRIAFIVALVLLILGVGTVGTIALLNNHTSTTNNRSANTPIASNANGTVSFSDSQNGSGHSNVVTINVRGLSAPPTGSQYNAWIVDTQSEHATGLGTLIQNKDGTYTAKSTDSHHNVLSLGNRVVVTLEQGTVTVPTGQVVLSAAFPPKAFIHIKHLLVSFPDTPGKIGLLVGLIDQAQKLSSASQLLQSISASQNSTAIQCAAQSIIDIAEGTQGSHYQPLANQCAAENIAEIGDGYGLLGTGGYIANGEAHASLAATQSDTTVTIRVHAGHVAICLENMKGWVTTIDHDAQALLNNPTDSAKVQEIVTLANHAFNGFDANGDGSIDPIPGEGGAVTAHFHGQLMATLVLASGS
jgi:hypothetical protein